MKALPTQRFRTRRELLDAPALARVIRRMAGQLMEREPDFANLMLVGIRTRGVPLAERLRDEIVSVEGVTVPLGVLDITLYRDDLSTIGPQPIVKGTEFPQPVEGRVVVLCDDVLFTGRTVRAALDELKDYGRPRAVRLAVLIDRGHRELPIHADVVGKTVQTERNESVAVGFAATDGADYVRLLGPVASPSAEEPNAEEEQ